jgi:hypothetical protein
MKLLDILSESFKKERDMFEGINDADLNELASKDFDVNKFKSLNSYAKKIKYAKEMMGKPLGTGSSRMVFIIDDTKVLKLAKNKKGLIQNEVEIGWADDYYFDDILANVIDFDENNLWVIMELAKKVKKSDFKRLWGINFEDMYLYLNYVYAINHGKRSYIRDEVKEIMDESEDVSKVVDFMLNGDSLAGDLGNVSSWGLVKRDGVETLVLIDFGITNKIYQSYYK